ncbi:VOC family protein [Mycoplana sp. MJR14]|uniref:VOC family protein n=1 Tax=Mycoplana sp. MJR14 TaxID=3032583 RepID=UPI0023DCDDE3|nr:VOC family protein [Mycoplana sp. MJR14]MDF1632048.1 VOC family protein [Mycoplana sp. MJR14]
MTETSALASPTHAVNMPAHVDHAHLVVSDLPMMADWYRKIMGLSVLEQSPSGQTLGTGGRPLLTLSTDARAARASKRAPGLFHNAFLVPSRRELSRWLAHAAHGGVQLTGASDHLVSEALYLDDPEGNGIEVYRDRSRDEWNYKPDGMVEMSTLPLDVQRLYDEAPRDEAWTGLPEDSAMGHIHLQVSDIPQADAFFRDVLGLDLMARYPGASFFASGKYHHHVAANIWNSRGAARREPAMTGLADYTLRFADAGRLQQAVDRLETMEIATTRQGGTVSLIDPWGIGLKLSA